jgi:ABC-type lipoprotein release transport system permease subunit
MNGIDPIHHRGTRKDDSLTTLASTPLVCVASLALLAAVTVLACVLSARRAALVHPMDALRFE